MFVIPISEDDYIGRTPYVITGLAIINLVALAWTYLVSSSTVVFPQYGFTPDHPTWLTAFSSMFLHAGLLHFIGNTFFLWTFGYRTENTFRPWLFAIVYLLSGFGATALHYLFNSTSTIPCVGASGAISGIAGSYFVLFPNSRFNIAIFLWRFHVDTIPAHTRGAIGVWVAEQTILGLVTQMARFSSTAFWAHVGGFATGVTVTCVLVFLFPNLRKRGEQPIIARLVKGIVQDARGKPLPNASFEIEGNSGAPVVATTSKNGRFLVEKIPDGYYSFTVSKDGWQSVRGNIVLRKRTRYSRPMRITMRHQPTEDPKSEDRILVSQS